MVNEQANSLDSQLLHTTSVLHIRQASIHIPYTFLWRNVDSTSIVSDYWLNDRGSVPGKSMLEYFRHNIRTAFAAHKASYLLSTGQGNPEYRPKAAET
jgi:hypothetical protein